MPSGNGRTPTSRIVGRPVEYDLLVPGDRHQGRPRAGRHRHARRLASPGGRTARSRAPRASRAGPPACPCADGSSLNSNFGLALAGCDAPRGLERPGFDPACGSRRSRRRGSSGDFGGILGSSLWLITRRSVLPSASPGSTTLPEPPPCIAAPKVSRFRPPFCLSALWQCRIGCGRSARRGPRRSPCPSAGRRTWPAGDPHEQSTGIPTAQRCEFRLAWSMSRIASSVLSPRCMSRRTVGVTPNTQDQWLNKNSRLLSSAQKRSSRACAWSLFCRSEAASVARSSAVGRAGEAADVELVDPLLGGLLRHQELGDQAALPDLVVDRVAVEEVEAPARAWAPSSPRTSRRSRGSPGRRS